jgi:hypothetical protein
MLWRIGEQEGANVIRVPSYSVQVSPKDGVARLRRVAYNLPELNINSRHISRPYPQFGFCPLLSFYGLLQRCSVFQNMQEPCVYLSHMSCICVSLSCCISNGVSECWHVLFVSFYICVFCRCIVALSLCLVPNPSTNHQLRPLFLLLVRAVARPTAVAVVEGYLFVPFVSFVPLQARLRHVVETGKRVVTVAAAMALALAATTMTLADCTAHRTAQALRNRACSSAAPRRRP